MGPVVGGFRLGPLARATARGVLDGRATSLAAEAAYYLLFSLVPLLLVVMPLVGLVSDPRQVFAFAMSQLALVTPPEALAVVRDVVESVVFAPGAPALVSVGAVTALWSASGMFDALARGLNAIGQLQETRPWWRRKLTSVGLTLAVGVLALGAAAVLLAGPELVRLTTRALGAGGGARALWTALQYPLGLVFAAGALWLVYYVLPNVRTSKRLLLVGAAVGVAVWAAATLGFRLYVQQFGNYNKTYGALGGVIVLLTWMYVSMLAVLVGGELNQQLRLGTGSVRPRAVRLYAGPGTVAAE